ncbi:hypothetical protein LSH36_371g03022, partial [Paralvinella palmiformis]
RKHRQLYLESTHVPACIGELEQPSVFSFMNKTDKKYSTTDPRQLKATDALISLLADDMLPLSLVMSASFRKFQTADNISNAYDEVTASYDLTGKVSNVITDNASNLLKAFRLPGFSTEPDSDDEDESKAVDLNDDLQLLTEHDSCFAHSLQLIVKDGFKDTASLNKVLSKAANIVSHVS